MRGSVVVERASWSSAQRASAACNFLRCERRRRQQARALSDTLRALKLVEQTIVFCCRLFLSVQSPVFVKLVQPLPTIFANQQVFFHLAQTRLLKNTFT